MRNRLFGAGLLCLLAAAWHADGARAVEAWGRVDEAATRVEWKDGETRVALAVENFTGRAVAGEVRLEWLDPKGRVEASAERRETIRPGASVIRVSLALNVPARWERQTVWRRLRYRVAASAGGAELAGVVALSEITPDLFELHLLSPSYLYPGKTSRAYVRAFHPTSGQPVRGVRVEARLRFGDESVAPLRGAGETDAQGRAIFDFALPREMKMEDGAIEVTGVRGEFRQRIEEDLRTDHLRLSDLLLTTDKPIYQPGQTLHLRTLAFDFARRAQANQTLTLRITDPEGTMQYRAAATTSRFGVATVDWQIPENARLGDYTITAGFEGEASAGGERDLRVRVSRYELPTFAVKPKPDRRYYLPGQNAEIEVRADYLFGQPVRRGRVRVVREREREWSYRKQAWEIREGEVFEGETDEAGRYVARIDLSAAHAEIQDAGSRRFEDLTYAVYFTDASTGRTEQRRVDLRLTRDPIHLYILGESDQGAGLPVQFYLAASYADGTPAACRIAIRRQAKVEIPGTMRSEMVEEPLTEARTNRYGVAKVAGLRLRAPGDENVKLVFEARDAAGRTGREEETLWRRNSLARVNLDKALYRAGEPIEVEILSSQPRADLILSLTGEQGPLHSQGVRIRNGRAFVVVPWRRAFVGAVQVTVHAEPGADDPRVLSRVALYPRDREPRLVARLDRPAYRPGEEASASFRMLTAEGRPIESALGVTVLDRAVEERARTDREFSGRSQYVDYLQSHFASYRTLGGLTIRDLNRLDLSQPLPPGLGLVAEMLLYDNGYESRLRAGSEYEKDAREVFREAFQRELGPVLRAIETQYEESETYPADLEALRRVRAADGRRFDELRDPWGTPFRAEFATVRELDQIKIVSAGADKRHGTEDDFVAGQADYAYFKAVGRRVERALWAHLAAGGRVLLDAQPLREELERRGIAFDELRDPWGRPYALEASLAGAHWNLAVRSAGENGRFEIPGQYPSDDFAVWTTSLDYFGSTRDRVQGILAAFARERGRLPEDEREFRAALAAAGLAADALQDPWGREPLPTFSHRFAYGDRTIVNYDELRAAAAQRTEVRPATHRINFLQLQSAGADGKPGTSDDFTLAEFTRIETVRTSADATARPAGDAGVSTSGATGAIRGLVVDAQDAVIASTAVAATNRSTGIVFQAKTGADGVFLLANLPLGLYDLRFVATGFKGALVMDVPVRGSSITELRVALEIGSIAEAVSVAGGDLRLQTQASSMAEVKTVNALSVVSGLAPQAAVGVNRALATPRLREHFQETLVWQPSIETDAQGRAQLKFKLADNITAWKMKVVGSTADGEIAMAEKEFLAFQPFFAEHDPPRTLTEGDEISLPVVVRNYLPRAQSVLAEMRPENWFALLGPTRRRIEVPAGDAARAVFEFRATSAVGEGKQRVTVLGGDDADAIERPVAVHPNGEEISRTASALFREAGDLTVELPADAIPGSARAELKLYPNLFAHAFEGIEGLLQRPYGCGEQTISSTYPNVMALRALQGRDAPPADLAARARRNVQRGYERLLGYRNEDGGFTYWGVGDSDAALTAYALRFLTDAAQFIAVDEDVIAKARKHLLTRQTADGRWAWRSWRGEDEGLLQTAYVARVLAADARGTNAEPGRAEILRRTLAYLGRRAAQIDEPYLIASYALAQLDAGDRAAAEAPIAKLRALARDENGGRYWHLEANTPFYGWGLAGRIETTALALLALRRFDAKPDELQDRGLLFLLRNKDRYGVWLSTQATINVLDALTSFADAYADASAAAGPADVFVNGRRIASVEMPPADRASAPLPVDLTAALGTGRNRIEIRRAGKPALATAQLVASHYAPWPSAAEPPREALAADASRALRLAVRYDKPRAVVGETITCVVTAERIGHRGEGMMLGEIGLPPGAEVDRASLDRAVKEAGWGLNHYDVLPDRVVVYLWPRAGGTTFSFSFHLRYGIRARTAPSSLYDYYNPEARVVLPPVRFEVR